MKRVLTTYTIQILIFLFPTKNRHLKKEKQDENFELKIVARKSWHFDHEKHSIHHILILKLFDFSNTIPLNKASKCLFLSKNSYSVKMLKNSPVKAQ